MFANSTMRSMPGPYDGRHGCWGLAAIPARDASSVVAFAEHLCLLPRSEWLAVGARLAGGGCVAERRAAAGAILDAIITDRRFEVTAWYVRDLVETMAAGDPARPASKADLVSMAAARRAAERAALALALRSHLPREDFAALLAPFAHRAPVENSDALDAAA